jgi:glycosyltransferase involved in cell wall biosynthesis
MKVAIHLDGPTVRGNERQTIRIAAGLRERGHEVVVSCRRRGPVQDALEAAGVRTTGIRPRGDADLWSAARFAAWLRREAPDAVLLTSWKRAFIGAAAARAAGVPRRLFRLGLTQPLPAGFRGLPDRLALARWCHGVIVNSRAVGEHVRRSLPDLPPERLITILNGIEPQPAAPAALRQTLGLPTDAVIVLALGGAEAIKGFDLIVESAPALDPRVHVVLAGGGPPDRRARLLERARELKVAHRIHLLEWRTDVPALLAASDVFVLSSRAEGMSVAMLEAMAAGLPVVAADVGGVWDAIAARDGRPAAGWIVPPEDPRALGAAVDAVFQGLSTGGMEVRARIGEARWRIDHWFTIARMIDAYEAALAADPR